MSSLARRPFRASSPRPRCACLRGALLLGAVLLLPSLMHAHANAATASCPDRPAAGSGVLEPPQRASVKGVLRVDFHFRRSIAADGQVHYCYLTPDGMQNPTLRLRRGDWLILRLRNDLPDQSSALGPRARSGCIGMAMAADITNLHFHGLDVPPRCHQDDVLRTSVRPGGAAFEYRLRIPLDEPAGLYWYHPHVHGFSSAQVLGGASGALIVEGLAHEVPPAAAATERVLIVRDQELLQPDAAPVQSDSMPAPLVLRDAEGDVMNTGTGLGRPAKDLSINFVPVAYPRYAPALITMAAARRELWRILNASAITYLDLQVLIGERLQAFGVVALDGIALHAGTDPRARILGQSHALVPPGGRIEMLVEPPPPGTQANLVTRTVDTGPAGENDPTRPLARMVVGADAPPAAVSPASPPSPSPLAHPVAARAAAAAGPPWLGDVPPARTRHLYFSERAHNAQSLDGPSDFFLTVEGREPRMFDPHALTPDIVARQGDVEEWVIENRTRELHAFHIHQSHFLLMQWNGVPLSEPYLRDTINVGYWDGISDAYPSVTLRMDFRDPNSVGDFVYHCHVLEHEDGGMMGMIRVLPRASRVHADVTLR